MWRISPVDHRVNLRKWEKTDKYLDIAEEAMEHETDTNTYCSWWEKNGPYGFGKDTEGILRSEEESRPQHCLDQQENFEDSWRRVENFCYSDCGEKLV